MAKQTKPCHCLCSGTPDVVSSSRIYCHVWKPVLSNQYIVIITSIVGYVVMIGVATGLIRYAQQWRRLRSFYRLASWFLFCGYLRTLSLLVASGLLFNIEPFTLLLQPSSRYSIGLRINLNFRRYADWRHSAFL